MLKFLNPSALLCAGNSRYSCLFNWITNDNEITRSCCNPPLPSCSLLQSNAPDESWSKGLSFSCISISASMGGEFRTENGMAWSWEL
jgi:hypothetical protein